MPFVLRLADSGQNVPQGMPLASPGTHAMTVLKAPSMLPPELHSLPAPAGMTHMPFCLVCSVQCTFMAFAVGTLFLHQGKNGLEDGQMFLGVMYFSIMTQMFVSFAAPSLLIQRMPVYLEQRDAHFYPGWCYALPEVLMQVPSSTPLHPALLYCLFHRPCPTCATLCTVPRPYASGPALLSRPLPSTAGCCSPRIKRMGP